MGFSFFLFLLPHNIRLLVHSLTHSLIHSFILSTACLPRNILWSSCALSKMLFSGGNHRAPGLLLFLFPPPPCKSHLGVPVSPLDGSQTWGRQALVRKEELVGTKKKGRTWGPSSTIHKERLGGEERCWGRAQCGLGVERGTRRHKGFRVEARMVPQEPKMRRWGGGGEDASGGNGG